MNIEDLKAYGANVEEGLGRCMGNEGMYLRLVGMIRDDAAFEELPRAIEAGDLDAAFDFAHGLRGSLANLAVTPLLEPMCEITELLRARTETDYAPLLAQIAEQHEKLRAL